MILRACAHSRPPAARPSAQCRAALAFRVGYCLTPEAAFCGRGIGTPGIGKCPARRIGQSTAADCC